MFETIVAAAGELAPAALIVIVVLAARRLEGAWAAGLFVLLFFADALLLNIRTLAPGLPLPASPWNWAGKLAAFGLALGALALLPAPLRTQAGLFRLPPRKAVLPLIIVSLATIGLALARTVAFAQHQVLDGETLLFQATMPGLHEELTFRGVWWILLTRALEPAKAETGIPWRTLATTTILFGAVHAIALTPTGALSINWLFFAATALSGLLYGLLQGLGRAVWIPILTHNLVNVGIVLAEAMHTH